MFLHRPRLNRALSAFDHANHRWMAIPLRDPHHPIVPRPSSSRLGDTPVFRKQTLTLITWNVQASKSRREARTELILDHILKGPKLPDVIHLQEVVSSVRQYLLDDHRIRSHS